MPRAGVLQPEFTRYTICRLSTWLRSRWNLDVHRDSPTTTGYRNRIMAFQASESDTGQTAARSRFSTCGHPIDRHRDGLDGQHHFRQTGIPCSEISIPFASCSVELPLPVMEARPACRRASGEVSQRPDPPLGVIILIGDSSRLSCNRKVPPGSQHRP